MYGRVKTAGLLIIVLVTSAVVSFISIIAIAGKSDRIFAGVTVKEIHLGNMTGEKAKQALSDLTGSLERKNVVVTFNGGSGSFQLYDLDFRIDAAATVEKALAAGRRGNLLEQWRERKKMAREGKEIPLEFSVSKEKLQAVLDNLTREVRVPARDAKLVITPQEYIEIVESARGLGVDLEDAFDQLQTIVKDDRGSAIELKLIELNPSQTTEDVENMKVNGVLASYTTYFNVHKTNRVYNIKVAASALDGQIIKPGEVFSFNKVVGPRSEEAGYKMALTILNNEFVDALGGGVCQVSSTLYNMLLQADVEIIQRSSHSLVVPYIQLGQDAAVVYGRKDLEFRNNMPCALIIKSSVAGDALTFKLFGDTSLRKTVKVTNNIIKEYPFKIIFKEDPTLPKGQQVVKQHGTKGYMVTSRIEIYQDGMLIGSKSLSSSFYNPLHQIVLIGTGPDPGNPAIGGETGGDNNKPIDPSVTNPNENELVVIQAPSTPPSTPPSTGSVP